VSTTLPSVTEAVDDGVQGLLVPQRDPKALADALERLLGDDGLRRKLGAAGRARVEEKFDRRLCAPRVPELLGRAGLIAAG
jgi:glycosyltransferase involved in cell wall biosynthesis